MTPDLRASDEEILDDVERELRQVCPPEVRFRRMTLNRVPRLELERDLDQTGRRYFQVYVDGDPPENGVILLHVLRGQYGRPNPRDNFDARWMDERAKIIEMGVRWIVQLDEM